MSGEHPSGTQNCEHWEALALGLSLLATLGLYHSILPHPLPHRVPEVVASLAVYTGRSSGFLTEVRLCSELLCQLILWGMALSLLDKANGEGSVFFPDLLH